MAFLVKQGCTFSLIIRKKPTTSSYTIISW